MVKLKRLKINKYRNVRPGTELHFDATRNLVLGQNGSGKTTLLGLVAMISGWHFSALANEIFDLEFDLEAPGRRWQCKIANTRASSASARPFAYEYRITGLLPNDGDPVLRGVDTANYLSFSGLAFANKELVLPPVPLFEPRFFDRLAATITHDDHPELGPVSPWIPPQTTLAARYDEALGYFYGLTGQQAPDTGSAGLTSISTSYSRTVNPDGSVQFRYSDQNPHRIAAAVLEELLAQKTGPSVPRIVPASAVGWLRTFVELTKLSAGELIVNVDSASGESTTIAGFSLYFTLGGGATIPHNRLSYGQKRLLAFLFYMANCGDVVIADELVNGLHRRWIEVCMDALGERQAFLTSQNPLLFDYVEFDSIEQAQSRFLTCRSELVDGAVQLVWSNMPRDDAAAFFRGYEAEIEGVGDILINRGLW